MNENKSNDTTLFIALIVLCGLIIYGMKYISPFLYEFWRWVRVFQLSLFSWLPDMGFSFGDTSQNLHDLMEVGNKQISKHMVKAVDGAYYPVFGWLAVIFIFTLSRIRNKSNERVKEKLDMEQILKKYAKVFPMLKPYVDFDPTKMEDLFFERDNKKKLGYLPALQPLEYATMVPPLHLEKEAEHDSSIRAPIWSECEGFDEDLAEKSFQKQLGERFTGLENMSPIEKKIYSDLVKKIAFDRKSMQSIMMKMAKEIVSSAIDTNNPHLKTTYSGPQLALFNMLIEIHLNNKSTNKKYKLDDERLIRKLLLSKAFKQPLNDVTGEQIMKSHGFVSTGLMSMIKEAGIPSLEFNYVKHENRTLFYALSCVGKKVAFAESAGIFAHWLIECHINKAITTPEVTEAIQGLKIALMIEDKYNKK